VWKISCHGREHRARSASSAHRRPRHQGAHNYLGAAGTVAGMEALLVGEKFGLDRKPSST